MPCRSMLLLLESYSNGTECTSLPSIFLRAFLHLLKVPACTQPLGLSPSSYVSLIFMKSTPHALSGCMNSPVGSWVKFTGGRAAIATVPLHILGLHKLQIIPCQNLLPRFFPRRNQLRRIQAILSAKIICKYVTAASQIRGWTESLDATLQTQEVKTSPFLWCTHKCAPWAIRFTLVLSSSPHCNCSVNQGIYRDLQGEATWGHPYLLLLPAPYSRAWWGA